MKLVKSGYNYVNKYKGDVSMIDKLLKLFNENGQWNDEEKEMIFYGFAVIAIVFTFLFLLLLNTDLDRLVRFIFYLYVAVCFIALGICIYIYVIKENH